MSIEKIMKEAMNRNSIGLKESLQEELRSRISLALEAKMTNESTKSGYYFWDIDSDDLYSDSGHYKTFKDISKIDMNKLYGSNASGKLMIGYMDDEGFWTVDGRGNKKRKL
jgi:hypothetical protein